MDARALTASLKNAIVALVSIVIFPLAWLQAARIVKRHTEDDPKGMARLTVGIVAGLVLAGGGAMWMVGFEQDGVDGIYETLDTRLSVATGNEAYKSARDEGRTEDQAALEGNRQLYEQVHVAVMAKDDAKVKQLIADRPAGVDFENIDVRTASAFRIKDDAVADQRQALTIFVYPGIVGLLFAPLVWAVGRTLQKSFVPSDTVGFKQYPSGAASLFLLLGAFGWPGIPFAAWVLNDMNQRSTEGQIAL